MQDTCRVARELIGKTLVRKYNGSTIRAVITETEAYKGFNDKASHASRGKTMRTRVMFSEAGMIYVYLIYGMHHCLNIVTEQKDFPAAVLIRSVKLIGDGAELKGPGRLTRALSIDRALNGKPLGRKTGLWIEENAEGSARRVGQGARLNVAYAGAWAKKPWRFYLKSR